MMNPNFKEWLVILAAAAAIAAAILFSHPALSAEVKPYAISPRAQGVLTFTNGACNEELSQRRDIGKAVFVEWTGNILTGCWRAVDNGILVTFGTGAWVIPYDEIVFSIEPPAAPKPNPEHRV
jgi:hypothetical protein